MTAFVPVYCAVRLLTAFLRTIRWHRWLPRLHALLGVRRRVLYLEVFYPGASGYQYRVAQWLPVLESAGFETRVRYALSGAATNLLLGGGWTGLFLSAYMLRRALQCLTAPFYSCVVVRRELLLYNDYGDLFLERFLLALNPSVVLDFDDDISAAKQEPRPISRTGRVLRENPSKFGESLDLYPQFIAGSGYLAGLVRARTERAARTDIEVIPTCVDYHELPPKIYDGDSGVLTFGWIGTNGNLPELERIVPDLAALARDQAIRLIVISGKDLAPDAAFPVENRRWALETQIQDLREIDVGLMPLTDSWVARGKCGFKLLQYMGLGIVSVASAITTNREIVSAEGVDGFLVEPDDDWDSALRRVVAHRTEFAQIGARARERVREHYSVESNAERYAACITRACTDS